MEKMEELGKFECNIVTDYKIIDILKQLNEMHDKIILREIVAFCNEYKILDYEVSIDMLKEALNLYMQKKEREKFGKDINVATKWIPVSERLPEESGYYLASVAIEDCYSLEVFEKVFVRWFAHPDDYFITEGEWREGINNEFINESITAWMPLPKAYTESGVE